MDRRAVIAIGGNALILDGQRGTIAEQYENAGETAQHIAALVAGRLGRGPDPRQRAPGRLHPAALGAGRTMPPRCRASSSRCRSPTRKAASATSWRQALLNELAARGLPDRVVCVLTHTVVDEADPAFQRPDQADRALLHRSRRKRTKREPEAGRWSRTPGGATAGSSPRPEPLRIVEAAQIRALVEAGFVVIAVGGGGIPVVETAPGTYRGVEAVIDKDRASALLAASLDVPLLVLSTGVEQVAVHFRQPDQRWLDRITVAEAARLPGGRRVPEGQHGSEGRGGDPIPRARRPGGPHHHAGTHLSGRSPGETGHADRPDTDAPVQRA